MTEKGTSRRGFLEKLSLLSLGAAAVSGPSSVLAAGNAAPDAKILGEAGVATSEKSKKRWEPVSDRKIRVGIVGNGVCKFGPSFGFQDHPNVTVAAVSDLIPEQCSEMAKVCRCSKTYPSLEELVKDDSIEAVYVATDAPSHVKHCIEVLKHGKHVACAVPAVFGSVDQAYELLDCVKSSGKKYMLFETSAFRDDNYAMRQIYKAGGFGKLVYSEGEYFHFGEKSSPSFRNWRQGLPPQWYPTHSNAYYVCVTGGSFTEVSGMGMPSVQERYQPGNNPYKNRFGTEVALLRTSEGGMARMAVCWDSLGGPAGVEVGRVRGQRGGMWNGPYDGKAKKLPDLEKPALPPGVAPGHHGGSSGYLMNEFVMSILEDRKPLVDIIMALNLTVPGIMAHQSAVKDGELLKIPQFEL